MFVTDRAAVVRIRGGVSERALEAAVDQRPAAAGVRDLREVLPRLFRRGGHPSQLDSRQIDQQSRAAGLQRLDSERGGRGVRNELESVSTQVFVGLPVVNLADGRAVDFDPCVGERPGAGLRHVGEPHAVGLPGDQSGERLLDDSILQIEPISPFEGKCGFHRDIRVGPAVQTALKSRIDAYGDRENRPRYEQGEKEFEKKRRRGHRRGSGRSEAEPGPNSMRIADRPSERQGEWGNGRPCIQTLISRNSIAILPGFTPFHVTSRLAALRGESGGGFQI